MLGRAEVAEYFRQMAQHFAESHICHVPVVDDRPVSGCGRHHVASEKCEPGFGVGSPQSLDELRRVQVAGGFARYYEVVHVIRI